MNARFGHVCLLLAVIASSLTAVAAAQDADSNAQRMIVAFDRPDAVPAQGAFFGGASVELSRPEAGYIVIQTDDAMAHRLRGFAHVKFVEPDVVLHPLSLTPNDPQWSRIEQYGPRQVGAPDVWNTSLGASDVSICFVDSGIRVTHEDIAPSYVGGRDFVTGMSQPIDDMGHGTNVAGAAAATVNNGIGMAGVAKVGIRVAKVMSSTGAASGSALTDGIRWCTDQGSQVISISLGTTGYSQLLFDTIEYAWNHDVVIVASAGNSGPCSNCIEYPAKFDHVLAVGCFVSWNDKCPASSAGPELDLMAPGDKLLTTDYASDNGYVVRSGTSMAAPMVAAVAALMKSLDHGLTNQQIDDLLRQTAQDYGAAGFDQNMGYGLVRADRAAAQIGSVPPPPPPPATVDLAVAAMGLSRSSVVEGQTVWANASIQNLGNGAASAFTVQFKVDGVAVASQSIQSLAAGASAPVSFAWTSVRGNHSLQIVADSGSAVAESNEANNAASQVASVSAPVQPPVQVVRGVDLSAGQSGKVRGGKSITYTMTVKNTGNAADHVDLALGAVPSGWSSSISCSGADLGAGQSLTFTVTVTASRLPKGSSMSLQVSAVSGSDATVKDVATLTTSTV